MTRAAAAAIVAALVGGAGAAPVATSQPAVSGTLQQGSRLTANPGSWSAAGSVTFAYQWYRCGTGGGRCSSVHGATRAGYRVVAADVGHTLGVTVRATAGGRAAVAYAPLAGIVAPSGARFAAAAQPRLVGEAIVGRSLSIDAVRWTAAAPGASFRWLRCNANGRVCVTIDGARGVGYTLAGDDAGHRVIGLVTAAARTVYSVASDVVRTTPGPVLLASPSLAGTLRSGTTLNADAGVWSGGGTITFAYQWYRCDARGSACVTLLGATRNTYALGAVDAGHTLAVAVHATDSTGTSIAYSSLAGVIAPAGATLAARGQPSLDGVAALGQDLHAVAPATTKKPTATTYAWLRCTTAVRRCAPIAGAATDTYTVTAEDAGHALVAAVTIAAAGERLVTLSAAAVVG